MKCDLEISAAYSGESSNVEGTIEVDHAGQKLTHQISCSGSASDRGTHATINGKEYWWCGSEANDSGTGAIEEAVEEAYEDCWEQVEAKGIDIDGCWTAKYVDGQVVSVTEEEDEDE